MKKIGLHLRLATNFIDLIHQALRLNMSFFQCFLLDPKKNNKADTMMLDERKACKKLLQLHQVKGYVHASYAINLASGVSNAGLHFLKKELLMAKQCGFSEIVLHPGSATGCADRLQGIDNLVRRLNMLLKNEKSIKIILENAAFGANSIGGDLQDFKLVRSKLDQPEKVGFCIDTAHAYAYGYDIADEQEQELFIDLIGQTIGFDALSLIHLNDTKELLSSKRDRHDIIGNGVIGAHYLKRFMHHEKLASIPVLLELPSLPEDEQKAILHTVNSW